MTCVQLNTTQLNSHAAFLFLFLPWCLELVTTIISASIVTRFWDTTFQLTMNVLMLIKTHQKVSWKFEIRELKWAEQQLMDKMSKKQKIHLIVAFLASRESWLMNILLGLVLSGQVPCLQSKNWIGNLLKMNYFEFSFRENEISAVKVCMATAGNLGCGQVYTFK